MFAFRAAVDPGSREGARVDVAFTDASLDLQGRPDKVDRFVPALAALEAAVGITFARLNQVHGDAVVEVDEPWGAGSRAVGDVPVADALVSATSGVGLMVRVADCVPVVLADAGAGIIGAAHAGRRGVELGVVTRTAEHMHDLGATTIRAWIGPHICGRCYEVPSDLRDAVAAVVPETYAETSWGTPSLDLGAGVEAQLAKAGVPAERVPGCTLEDARFHSYRRDGAASGRFAGLVWLS